MFPWVEKTKILKNIGSDNIFIISPIDFGINIVPLSVLEKIFEKGRSLVRNNEFFLKPGATDVSYIVS